MEESVPMLTEDSQASTCENKDNIVTVKSPAPLKIINIEALTSQEQENTEFKIVSPRTVGKRFLSGRIERKKSAVKRLSITDRQISDMLEKSGESSDTDIEFLGEVINDLAPEVIIQVHSPASPMLIEEPSMSDRMPPLLERMTSREESSADTQIEIPAIGSESGRTMNIPIPSAKASVLNQILTRSLGPITSTVQTNSTYMLRTSADIPPLIRAKISQVPIRPVAVLARDEPKLTTRIMAVMTILTRPSDHFTVVEISNCIKNEWSAGIEQLLHRWMRSEPVYAHDLAYYRNLAGFFFHQLLCEASAHERSYASYYPCRLPEYAFDPREQDMLPYQCMICTVGHFRSEACPEPVGNGPRNLTSIYSSKTWRNGTKAIIIGCSRLLYLPAALKDSIVNLSMYPNLTYYVDKPDHFPNPANSSLFNHIMSIIKIIGCECSYPIFVEFSPSGVSPHLSIYHHLCGFIKICKVLQKHYMGPIIPTFGIINPLPNESRESYNLRKDASRSHKLAALALGLAMGVPVGIIDIQNFGPNIANMNPVLKSWKDESLFGRDGRVTKEYQQRLTDWFLTRAELFDFYPPHERGLARATTVLHDG